MRRHPGKILTILFAVFLCAGALVAGSGLSWAQEKPALPAPLQNMVGEGAQIRYLGHSHGLDGWIAIKSGQEQYFYVTPDGQAFVMGLLFDDTGKLVTMRQVQELQQSSEGRTLDLFAMGDQAAAAGETASEPGANISREFKTPAEQLLSDVEGSNWIPLGNPDAPYIYTFIDPQCPHCHVFMNDLRRDYIDSGLLQVRMIPVGFKGEEARAQAAFLLAVPNPQKRWWAHIDGEAEALPASPDINQQGVQRNMAIMQSWKVNVTPFTVYRANNGEVKIIQGRAQDIRQIIADTRPGK